MQMNTLMTGQSSMINTGGGVCLMLIGKEENPVEITRNFQKMNSLFMTEKKCVLNYCMLQKC